MQYMNYLKENEKKMLEEKIDNDIIVRRYQLFQSTQSLGFMGTTIIRPFIEFFVPIKQYDKIRTEKTRYLRDPFDVYMEELTVEFLNPKELMIDNIIGYEKHEFFGDDDDMTVVGYIVKITISSIEPKKKY